MSQHFMKSLYMYCQDYLIQKQEFLLVIMLWEIVLGLKEDDCTNQSVKLLRRPTPSNCSISSSNIKSSSSCSWPSSPSAASYKHTRQKFSLETTSRNTVTDSVTVCDTDTPQSSSYERSTVHTDEVTESLSRNLCCYLSQFINNSY